MCKLLSYLRSLWILNHSTPPIKYLSFFLIHFNIPLIITGLGSEGISTRKLIIEPSLIFSLVWNSIPNPLLLASWMMQFSHPFAPKNVAFCGIMLLVNPLRSFMLVTPNWKEWSCVCYASNYRCIHHERKTFFCYLPDCYQNSKLKKW